MSINQISILMLIPPMLLAALIIFGVASHFTRAFFVGVFKGIGEHRTIPGQKLSTSAKAVPRELKVAGARMSQEFRAAGTRVTEKFARVSMEFRVARPNRPSIIEAATATAPKTTGNEPVITGRKKASPSIVSI